MKVEAIIGENICRGDLGFTGLYGNYTVFITFDSDEILHNLLDFCLFTVLEEILMLILNDLAILYIELIIRV